MFDVLKLLTAYKIVQIFGLPGLGKSSLLKNVCVYLGERNFFKDGLVYIDLNQITTMKEALEIVNMYLTDHDEELEQFQKSFVSEKQKIDNEKQMIKFVLGPMKSFLIAFDNIDHLMKNEFTSFLNFMKELSQKTKVKFLFTSSRFQHNLFNENCGIKKLRRLTLSETVELFITKIPLSDVDKQNYFEYQNIKELDEYTVKFYKELGYKK